MNLIEEHLVKDRGATLEQAKIALQGWEIKPIIWRGQQVGELMLRQNEVHIALRPDARLKLGRRTLMKEQLDQLLETRDFLVTKLFKGDRYKRLIEFMGFRKIDEKGNVEHFWLDKETRNDCA
jgi:hypothetical protein